MAIAKISHIRLVGLRRDQNKILDLLSARGLFEARQTDALPFGEKSGDTGLYRSLKLKQSKISFALDFLKARHNEMDRILKENKKAVKRGTADKIDYTLSGEKYSGPRILITRADFADAAAKEYDLLSVCDELEKLSFEIVELQARQKDLESRIVEYTDYLSLPIKFSELKIKNGISLAAYYGKTSASPAELLNALPCAYEIIKSDGIVVVAICREKNFEKVDKQISSAGYVRCTFDDDCTARQKIFALTSERKDVMRLILEKTENALSYEKYLKDLRILYDVIGLDTERVEAEQNFVKTDSTFVLEGWLPESIAKTTADEIGAEYENVLVQLLAPEEKDAPPTLVVNNAVIKPYEQITDMYSSPRYREIDPNPIMAIFYFLFFGIMIGDAAYGVILAFAGFFIGRSKKFDTGVKKLAMLIGMGGISAVIWGILFGGYFSIDFGFDVAVLLNPIDQPLLLLVLSMGLGCLQLAVGYIIKFVALCKEGKPFSAVFDCGSILFLFAALAFLVVGMLPSLSPMLGINTEFVPPEWITTVAVVLALIGIALIIVFGGRNSKNVFGKVVGGFKGLYGLVNILSDILSYCRLFGLCLASCAIGLAFNSLGDILFGIPYIGYVVGIPVLALLHAFNLGLGVLSAYVHDARLQFLEFYGKFYDGGGRLFDPLGSRKKYIRFE